MRGPLMRGVIGAGGVKIAAFRAAIAASSCAKTAAGKQASPSKIVRTTHRFFITFLREMKGKRDGIRRELRRVCKRKTVLCAALKVFNSDSRVPSCLEVLILKMLSMRYKLHGHAHASVRHGSRLSIRPAAK
jgi:hypothetical protein